MKTMKKVISVLLLVGMLASLCVTSAYADEPTTPSLSISVPSVASSETITGTATFGGGANASDYTITWHYSGSVGGATATAVADSGKGDTDIQWISDRLVNGSQVYATAVKDGETVPSLTSAPVMFYYNDMVSSVSVTPSSATLTKDDNISLTAAALAGTASLDITGKTVTWAANPDVLSFTAGAITTATVKADATVNNNGTVSVTATIDGVASSAATITLSVPAAPAPVTPVTLNSVTVTDNGDGTYTATPNFSDGASYPVTWSWSAAPATGITINNSTTATCTPVNTTTDPKTFNLTASAIYNGGTPVQSTATSVTLAGNPKSMSINYVGNLYAGGQEIILSAVSEGTTITPANSVTYSITEGAAFADLSGNKLTTKTVGGTVKVSASCTGYTLAEELTLVIADGISFKLAEGDSHLVAGAGGTKTLVAYYTLDTAQTPITGVTWALASAGSNNIATLSGSTVTAGSTYGTVSYKATLAGKELSGTVSVVVDPAPGDIDFSISVNSNNTHNDVTKFNTLTTRGGVLSLWASNAYNKDTKATVPGKFSFVYVPGTGYPHDGISLTDKGDGTASVYGRYNGSYAIYVTFTPDNTALQPVVKPFSVNVKYTPAITSGNYGVWDGVNGLSFIVNDSYYNYNGKVFVDGHELSNTNYVCQSSPDGQILVTLTPAFISWLRQYYNGNGIHTISIGNKLADNATGYFKTWGTASSFNGVKTGDDSNLALWAVLLGVSAVGAVTAVVIYKRKKSKS